MNGEQIHRMKVTVNAALQWHASRIVYDNEPLAVYTGQGGEGRKGWVQILAGVEAPIGYVGGDSRSTTEGGKRVVRVHTKDLVSFTVDLRTLSPKEDAGELLKGVRAAFQWEAIEEENEAVGLSLVTLGQITPLPFNEGGGEYSRAALDVRLYVTSTHRDPTAAQWIETASYTLEPEQ